MLYKEVKRVTKDGTPILVEFWHDGGNNYSVEIEVGVQPEGTPYDFVSNEKGITGNGSLAGMIECLRVIREFMAEMSKGSSLFAIAGDECRASAYRVLMRYGFVPASEVYFYEGKRTAKREHGIYVFHA